MGKQSAKIIAGVLAGLLSIPAVFIVSLWYFWRMVQAEYASGARVSTDGDTVTIPAVGVTTAWSVLLLAGVGVLLVMRIVRRGKRGAAGEQADEALVPGASGKSGD
jgi:TRAP-type mannitol/chloroaromatic compound transport system permease small subunit